MEVLKTRKLVTEIRIHLNRGEETLFMLTSDWHVDNPKCKRDILFEDLNEAKSKGAKIIVNGDLFCFMQGKYDPRRSKNDIRPEHNKADYINAVIDDTIKILTPYKDHIIAVAYGNHETALLKNLEIDVLKDFVLKFNLINNTSIVVMPYNGWIVFTVNPSKTSTIGNITYKIKYKHGYGGGGPVTKGTIQHAREIMWTEGADAIWMGHTHDCYAMPVPVERFKGNPRQPFEPEIAAVYMLRTPSYKHEYKDGGWAIEKGHPPRVMGCMWLRLKVATTQNTGRRLLASYTPKIAASFDVMED